MPTEVIELFFLILDSKPKSSIKFAFLFSLIGFKIPLAPNLMPISKGAISLNPRKRDSIAIF